MKTVRQGPVAVSLVVSQPPELSKKLLNGGYFRRYLKLV